MTLLKTSLNLADSSSSSLEDVLLSLLNFEGYARGFMHERRTEFQLEHTYPEYNNTLTMHQFPEFSQHILHIIVKKHATAAILSSVRLSYIQKSKHTVLPFER